MKRVLITLSCAAGCQAFSEKEECEFLTLHSTSHVPFRRQLSPLYQTFSFNAKACLVSGHKVIWIRLQGALWL